MKIVGWVVAAVMVLNLSAAFAAETWTRCPEQRRRIGQLEETGVNCAIARWVARRYDEQRISSGSWPGDEQTIGRFACRTRKTGPETYRIRCVRDPGEVVRFSWGV